MTLTDLVSILSGRGLHPKQAGKGFTSRCPAHEDKNPSLSISEGSDGRILLKCHAGCEFAAIAQALGVQSGDFFPPGSRKSREPRPTPAPKPKISKPIRPEAPKRHVATYDYRDEQGTLLFQKLRYEPKDFRIRRPDPVNPGNFVSGIGEARRVLFQLPELIAAVAANKRVWICDGEKDCHAMAAAGFVATSTFSGSDSAWLPEYTEFFRGADVVIIADKDKPDPNHPGKLPAGARHALKIQEALQAVAIRVRIIQVPDVGPTTCKDAADYLQAKGDPGALDSLADEPAEPEPEHSANGNGAADEPEHSANGITEHPFVPLGFDERGYLLLSRTEGYPLHFSASQLTKLPLYRLADDNYWYDQGFGGKQGIKWDLVAQHIISVCQKVGAYDATRVRGKGVYLDRDRVVFHAGNFLHASDSPGAPFVQARTVDLESDFVYPTRPSIRGFNLASPLDQDESSKLLELIDLCSWASPRDAIFYTGSLWLAFMPAVMPWRPHLYVQAESGTGKSWILNNIEKPLLGSFARWFTGPSSTEAGVRQMLGHDRLCAVIDEFDHKSVDKIFTLARQASSNDGLMSAKGTIEGVAKVYNIEATFIFHGTAAGMVNKPDKSRVAMVELLNRGQGFDATFARIEALAAATTKDPAWSARFAGRAMARVRETLVSFHIFKRAVAARIREARSADQYGALLAGAWMTYSDTPPSPLEAQGLVESMVWSGIEPDEADKDKTSCFHHLMAYKADYEAGGFRRNAAIGELLRQALDPNSTPDTQASALSALLPWGIKADVTDQVFYVANSHLSLETVFRESSFSGSKWQPHLKLLPGADSTFAIRFGAGIKVRSVRIPAAMASRE